MAWSDKRHGKHLVRTRMLLNQMISLWIANCRSRDECTAFLRRKAVHNRQRSNSEQVGLDKTLRHLSTHKFFHYCVAYFMPGREAAAVSCRGNHRTHSARPWGPTA